MAPTPAPGRSNDGPAQLRQDPGRNSLLAQHRRRRHFAVLAAIAVISAFVFVLLQPRDVHVLADGREMTIETQRTNDLAVLRAAGIDLQNGDRITQSEDAGDSVLQVERARVVHLRADGRTYELRTRAETIEQALDEASVVLQQRDSVMQNGITVSPNGPVEPPTKLASTGFEPASLPQSDRIDLEVRRAQPFVIADGEQEITSTTSRPTVAQALREAGIAVGPGDVVTPELRAAMSVDTRIEVRRAHPVTIALPDGHRVVYTLARTVREVLDEEGIVLPQGAFVHPSFDTIITSDMSVRVVQLGSSADVEYEYIESSTVYESDPSLDPGETRTVLGQDGVRVRRYDITYVDGAEIGRELIEDKLDPEPIDTVIYYPTRSEELDQPPTEAIVAGRTLRVYAVAYNAASAGRSPDDPNYGITATGVRVTWGVVAVDPDVIPLGTKMFIPGYGYAVAADTGGAVQGYIIDLGYPDGVAIDWVPQWLEIYVLE